jgi:glycosyltransferase involved in cell wall biosynthesis
MFEWIASHEHEPQVMLCGPSQWGDEKYEVAKKKNFTMQPLNVLGQNLYSYIMPDLYIVFSKFQPDIVLCVEEPQSLFTYNVYNLTRLANSRFIFFTWENVTKSFDSSMRKIESTVIPNADLCIAGNPEAANVLAIKSCGVNLIVLPQSGLDSEMFCPLTTIKVEKNKKKKKLLYSGRLVKEKDIEGILYAFDLIVSKEVPDVELHFVGGRGNELEKITKHKLYNKQIFWRGWTPYEKMPEIYNEADLFIYPPVDTASWKEQWGAACGEALLCEVPLITTTAGAIPQYWKSTDTHFVAQGDRDMLGWEIVERLENLNRAKAGRKHVVETCSLSVIGEKYLQCFEAIL